MKDLNKQRFEEEWRRAFEEAELQPGNDVWARLDAHLANQETKKYKNRLIWFQRIAAGLLLLLLAGGTWLWLNGNAPSPQLANVPTETGTSQQETARSSDATPSATADDGVISPNGTIARAERNEAPATREAQHGNLSGEHSRDLAQSKSAATEETSNSTVGTGRPAYVTPSPALSPIPKNGTSDSRHIARGIPHKQRSSSLEERSAQLPSDHTGEAIAVLEPSDAAANETLSGAPDESRMAFALLTPKYLSAKEPVIRPRSILPHLSEAYWAKVITTNEQEEKEEAKKEKRDRWQAGLAFAPGTYQPNFRVNESSSAFVNTVGNIAPSFASARTDASTLSAANRDLETASAAGLSYQTGVRMEYVITRRFSVQSGVDYLYNSSSVNTYSYVQNFLNGRNEPVFASILNYGNQTRSESMASDFIASPSPSNLYSDLNTKNLSQTTYAISVRNVYEYLAIPVKVNYLLLDKKLGASLGAGVSGDLFLNNRFGNEDQFIDEVNITSTKGTAYRKLGFSAWLGIKMQYRFAGKYSVFLEPSYRAAITSFTNTDALQSRPSLFSVGTGLQMRF
jgi:hypothetical protein